MIKVEHYKEERILQGDVIKNVEFIEYIDEEEGILEISKIKFPYVVVLSQDCDLAQDHTFRTDDKPSDKWLISVLVAPLYNAEHVYYGSHLEDLGIKSAQISKGKSPGDFLRNNQNPRYHFLEFPDSIPIVPSVIDFKHYFSVHRNNLLNLRKNNHICSIGELYREDISQRFSAFLSRIGLP